MPRIVVDLEKLRVLESGLGQFALELSWALLEHRRPEDKLTFFVPPGREQLYDGAPAALKIVRRIHKAKYYRRLQRYAHWFPGPSYDVWHITNQTSNYAPWNPRVPVLLTIHDLNFLREKPRKSLPYHIRELQDKVDRAKRITVISNFVADEVREWLDLGGRKLDVVYNGVPSVDSISDSKPKNAPNAPFIFTLGCFADKKNFHSLVEMMPLVPDMHLVIAGINETSYGVYMRRSVKDHGVADRVHMPGPISDNDRAWYYRNCRAFVFPSLTEGFGLPPVEAMSVGKPVFISNLTSLPEVGGNAAFYWENFQPEYMAHVLRQGLAAADAEIGFADRIRRHSQKFTWARAAQEYLAIYREMAAEQKSGARPAEAAPKRKAA